MTEESLLHIRTKIEEGGVFTSQAVADVIKIIMRELTIVESYDEVVEVLTNWYGKPVVKKHGGVNTECTSSFLLKCIDDLDCDRMFHIHIMQHSIASMNDFCYEILVSEEDN